MDYYKLSGDLVSFLLVRGGFSDSLKGFLADAKPPEIMEYLESLPSRADTEEYTQIVENSITFLQSIEDFPEHIVAQFTNEDFQENISNKLITMSRKIEVMSEYASRLKKYAFHNEMYSSDRNLLLYAYCLMQICLYDWRLNLCSSTDAINAVMVILEILPSTPIGNVSGKKINDIFNKWLFESDLPFHSGEQYSKFFINFPDENFDAKKLLSKNPSGDQISTLLEQAKDIQRVDEECNPDCSCKNETKEKCLLRVDRRNRAIFLLLFCELHGGMRLRYAREAERIKTSVWFRYEQYKAQITLNNASDYQRTRLTHSLEVAQQAKTVALQLGCNYELAEAAAIAHDIGHLPFGHQGEDALDKCLHRVWAGRFAHSFQSVNVLQRLAIHDSVYRKFGVSGLCLSRPVLEAVMKHDTDNFLHDLRLASWRLQHNKWQDALVYKDNEGNYSEYKSGLHIGTLESQIVYWADKIAYSGHDWDEFVVSNGIEKIAQRIEAILIRMHQLRHVAHGRSGSRKEINVVDIRDELDLIRYIRYRYEQLRNAFNEPPTPGLDSDAAAAKSPPPETNRHPEEEIYKALNPKKSKLQQICDDYSGEDSDNLREKFKKIPLKYFTEQDYELILDFFRCVLHMVSLTGRYPKAMQKNDDVVWVLCRYLTDTDSRALVRALQNHLINNSRKQIKTCNNKEDVLSKGKEAFEKSNIPDINNMTLTGIRKAFNAYGIVESDHPIALDSDANNDNKKTYTPKKIKKLFREHMQKEMLITLDEKIVNSLNIVNDFVKKYYVGSEAVITMNIKAEMMITKLFDFYMKHPEMLPDLFEQRIAQDAQRLAKIEMGDTLDGYKPLRLVERYLWERLQEQNAQHPPEKNTTTVINNMPGLASQVLNAAGLGKNRDDARGNEHRNTLLLLDAAVEKFCTMLENIDAMAEKSGYREDEKTKAAYKELCEHIAKARVIADYITSMTDRYAELKYTEITSSRSEWSYDYHG